MVVVEMHILPAADVTFTSLAGEPLLVRAGDPAVLESLVSSMEESLAAREGTAVPVLRSHQGGALGEVLSVYQAEDGAWVRATLTAQGVAVMTGAYGDGEYRYASGGFRFGADLETAELSESSMTPTPQFRQGQKPIRVVSLGAEEKTDQSVVFASEAVYCLAQDLPITESDDMTPEEIIAALAALTERLAAVESALAAMAPQEAAEPEHMADAEDAPAEPAAEDKVDVAASLAGIISRLDAMERRSTVQAAAAPAARLTPKRDEPSKPERTRLQRFNDHLAAGGRPENFA